MPTIAPKFVHGVDAALRQIEAGELTAHQQQCPYSEEKRDAHHRQSFCAKAALQPDTEKEHQHRKQGQQQHELGVHVIINAHHHAHHDAVEAVHALADALVVVAHGIGREVGQQACAQSAQGHIRVGERHDEQHDAERTVQAEEDLRIAMQQRIAEQVPEIFACGRGHGWIKVSRKGAESSKKGIRLFVFYQH